MDPVYYERFRDRLLQDERVMGAVAVASAAQHSPLVDEFDWLVLVVTAERLESNYMFHYSKDGLRIQERWIHEDGLRQWVLNGTNRNIVNWLLQGEVLFDRSGVVARFRYDLSAFPEPLRNQKLLIEFTKFLSRYVQARDYIQNGQVLDAFSNVLTALNHWARIAIIEHGAHPELTVWSQIHVINPGVYKLYEELTLSQETLEQRVKLVLLACEFSVMSKMKHCCKLLFDLLESRDTPWSAAELKDHPGLSELHIEISLLLKKLVLKSLIREVVYIQHDDWLPELRYTV